MKAFTIDSLNEISAWESGMDAIEASDPTFGSVEEMDSVFAEHAVKPVDVWNSLTGVVPVKKFTNRAIGIQRIWKQIQSLQPVPARPVEAPASATKAKKAKAEKTADVSAQAARTPREGSKQAQVVDLMKRADGVTLDEIMQATDWQRHTVRGFIAGAAKNKLGLNIESFKTADGQRAYRVVA